MAWLSKDMAEDSAGEWGMGGKLGAWPGAAEGEYGPLVVGEGVLFPPLPCWGLLLLERPASPWRLVEVRKQLREILRGDGRWEMRRTWVKRGR